MAWSTVFGPDLFIGSAFTSLPTYNAAYTQNGSNGDWRIGSNGLSAGCAAFASARCTLATPPAADQSAEFTIVGSSLQKEEGLVIRFTDGDAGNFWGGTGYLVYVESDNLLHVVRLDGGGSHTQLTTFSYTPTTLDVLRFEIIGTTWEVFVNAVSKGNGIDANYASGTVGLWSGSSLDDTGGCSIDNFTVQTWSGSAAGHPTMRRWGGTPLMGGRGIGQKGIGRAWGRHGSGIIVPSRYREAA
jgi:hypothetical protein